MFRVKICGLRNAADAVASVDAGADALGLNFYPRSPRFVTPQLASEIARAVPSTATKVGVFVNAALDDIRRVVEQVGLDMVQLHGDEQPEDIAQVGGARVIRAFRCRESSLDDIVNYVDRCRQLACLPCAALLDAFQPGTYGGTGRVVDWTLVPKLAEHFPDLPLVLAGGLTPQNVSAAIQQAQPWAVDTASGVESAPGVKDIGLVAQFVAQAREALGGIG
jgi:phosphoribosylanthranilate isomerase